MDYPITKGVPSFKEANTIAATPAAKKANAKLETSLFSADALGSEIATTKKYAKSGKGAEVNKGEFDCQTNVISPTMC